MDGANLPAVLLNPVHTQTSGVVPYVVVSQDLFLPGTFVTQCTKKLLERLKVCSALMAFHITKEWRIVWMLVKVCLLYISFKVLIGKHFSYIFPV
jgi:hypothetical protein